MPSGPAITLGLGPKIGPKGKRKRKGGRRCCTHVCVVAVQGRAGERGRNWALPLPIRAAASYDDTNDEGGSRREFWSFRVSDSSAFISIISRERFSFAHLHHQMLICIDSSGSCGIDDDACVGCGEVFAYLADSPCDRRARGHVHDHPSPPRAPRASPAPPTTRVSRSVHTSPGREPIAHSIHATAAPRRGRRRHRAPHTS